MTDFTDETIRYLAEAEVKAFLTLPAAERPPFKHQFGATDPVQVVAKLVIAGDLEAAYTAARCFVEHTRLEAELQAYAAKVQRMQARNRAAAERVRDERRSG